MCTFSPQKFVVCAFSSQKFVVCTFCHYKSCSVRFFTTKVCSVLLLSLQKFVVSAFLPLLQHYFLTSCTSCLLHQERLFYYYRCLIWCGRTIVQYREQRTGWSPQKWKGERETVEKTKGRPEGILSVRVRAKTLNLWRGFLYALSKGGMSFLNA